MQNGNVDSEEKDILRVCVIAAIKRHEKEALVDKGRHYWGQNIPAKIMFDLLFCITDFQGSTAYLFLKSFVCVHPHGYMV